MLHTFLEFLFQAEKQPKLDDVFPENEAVVTEVIRQGAVWRVSYRDSHWDARGVQPTTLLPGDLVYVVGSQNITLIIEATALPIVRAKKSLTLVSSKIDDCIINDREISTGH